MVQTSLDYDKIIWEVFAVGVVSSVLILYYFNKEEIPESWEILALALGFSVLVYSFILILGYGFKKSKLEKIIKDENNSLLINEEENIIQRELGRTLSISGYPRVRWMGEAILIFILIIYFKSFKFSYLWVPLSILVIFVIMCIRANYCAREE